MNITGGCHCGELKYTAVINAEQIIICHCLDCQKLSTSAFRTVARSAPNSLTFIKGQPKEYIKTAESGNKRAQGFCQHCGSHIYAVSVGEGDKIYSIRVGSSDQRDVLIPTSQIWTQSAQKWLSSIKNMKSSPQG